MNFASAVNPLYFIIRGNPKAQVYLMYSISHDLLPSFESNLQMMRLEKYRCKHISHRLQGGGAFVLAPPNACPAQQRESRFSAEVITMATLVAPMLLALQYDPASLEANTDWIATASADSVDFGFRRMASARYFYYHAFCRDSLLIRHAFIMACFTFAFWRV
ncbi:hypothetical protein NPIL_691901 [Nephila pilipes]|uniref:Uncharacterized protein n=1 Tax=Nephila pilipes TaxID=299642 RepID=A0A8X6NY92_NEPPI|nr:hypothetical protein NPIL_691901 [Nephila pilipes]